MPAPANSTGPHRGPTSAPVDSPRSFSVYGIGTVVVDHQLILDAFPEPDTKGEVLTDRYQVGGPVPTALCLLRRWGCPATFMGRWAADAFGGVIEADLRREGIDFTPPNGQTNARTGFAHVWVERNSGRRTIAAYRGSHPVTPEALERPALEATEALHLDGWSGDAARAAAEIVHSAGSRVFMDLGSPKPSLPALLENVDHVNCPARLLPRLFDTSEVEAGARRLLALGPRSVTVTDGAAGAWWVDRESCLHQAGYAIDAVDTNGAGDVFAGAILFATLQGWRPEQALPFACAAAALKCQQIGNRDALPTLAQITDLLPPL